MSSHYLQQIEWKISTELVEYEAALAFMEARVQAILEDSAPPCIWFLEHPPLYTAGTSAKAEDILEQDKFPIYEAGRGGEHTYHGPGQLVVYCMLDLKKLFASNPPDLRAYIKLLEAWIIKTLAEVGVHGEIREGRVGVWVDPLAYTPPACGGGKGGGISTSSNTENIPPFHSPPQAGGIKKGESKIAAIGVRVKRWVAFHGVSINVSPDLSHYTGIVPCGIKEYGVTSLSALGRHESMAHIINIMQRTLPLVY